MITKFRLCCTFTKNSPGHDTERPGKYLKFGIKRLILIKILFVKFCFLLDLWKGYFVLYFFLLI